MELNITSLIITTKLNDLWRESYINLIRQKKGLPLLDKGRKNYKIKRDSIIENLAFQFKKYINLSELLN